MDLLDFYRGRMSTRKLWVRIRGLPPDSATANLAHAGDAPQGEQQDQALPRVRYLEDIPVAKSLREVGSFLNASGDELSQMAQQAG